MRSTGPLLALLAALPLLVALQSAPAAVAPPGPAVPIGTILAWWGRLEDMPAGFEICDGKPPYTKEAVFTGLKPDLRGRFLRGADTPQSFNPRSYEVGGEDEVDVKLDDLMLSANQIPSHTHPMQHTHSLDKHVHHLKSDLALKPSDATTHHHSFSLPGHHHDLEDHVHALGGGWMPTPLVDGKPGDPEVLVKDAKPAIFSGSAVLSSNHAAPFNQTGTLPGGTVDTGNANGAVDTSTLDTDVAVLQSNASQEFTATGNVVGSAVTGSNLPAGQTQQPVKLGSATIDNRPAYTTVLWIVRVK